jgi:hypothetical protein
MLAGIPLTQILKAIEAARRSRRRRRQLTYLIWPYFVD